MKEINNSRAARAKTIERGVRRVRNNSGKESQPGAVKVANFEKSTREVAGGGGPRIVLALSRSARLKDAGVGGARRGGRGREAASTMAAEVGRPGVAAMAIRGFIRGSLLLPLKSLACCR